MRAEIIAALVGDICLGLTRSGFRRTLIISGHAEEENLAALRAGAEQATKTRALTKVSRWYADVLPTLLHLLEEEHPEYDFHAGEWETALALLKALELVDRPALDALPRTGVPVTSPNGEAPEPRRFRSWERRKHTAETLAWRPLRPERTSTRP